MKFGEAAFLAKAAVPVPKGNGINAVDGIVRWLDYAGAGSGVEYLF